MLIAMALFFAVLPTSAYLSRLPDTMQTLRPVIEQMMSVIKNDFALRFAASTIVLFALAFYASRKTKAPLVIQSV